MGRNYCEISGTVQIDSSSQEKLIRIHDAQNGQFLGEGISNDVDGQYSFEILKERGHSVYGTALTDYGPVWQPELYQ